MVIHRLQPVLRNCRCGLLLLLCCTVPVTVHGQAMTVVGGNQKARDCYFSAQMAAREMANALMLEDCNYALDNVSLRRKDSAATYTNRGIILLGLRKPRAALDDFEKAISIMPEIGEIYVNRGNAHFMTGDVDAALEDYQLALELEVSQPQVVHLNLGIAYEKAGKLELAEKSYLQALELTPEWTLARNQLQALQLKQEQARKTPQQ